MRNVGLVLLSGLTAAWLIYLIYLLAHLFL